MGERPAETQTAAVSGVLPAWVGQAATGDAGGGRWEGDVMRLLACAFVVIWVVGMAAYIVLFVRRIRRIARGKERE